MEPMVVLLIPTYNPPFEFYSFVQSLQADHWDQIVIVNDGSDPTLSDLFQQLELLGCQVISYEQNQGKGFALKKGFEFILTHYLQALGVVTTDDDQQHTMFDIRQIRENLISDPSCMVLGVRNFKEKGVPMIRRLANQLTSFFFLRWFHVSLPDTQTGLRGYPYSYLPKLITIGGNRFEYEMNVLIDGCSSIRSVPITTCYHQVERPSYFKGWSDSRKIFAVMYKKKGERQ